MYEAILISIKRTTSDHKAFRQLTQQLDDDLSARYGRLQASYDQHNVIDFIETVVLVYFEQQAVACGAFKQYDPDTVEIKRMYVSPNYRRMGIAIRLLTELERWAIELGYKHTILETGQKQAEALGLYQKQGYERIANYGPYVDQPHSICLRKQLV